MKTEHNNLVITTDREYVLPLEQFSLTLNMNRFKNSEIILGSDFDFSLLCDDVIYIA